MIGMGEVFPVIHKKTGRIGLMDSMGIANSAGSFAQVHWTDDTESKTNRKDVLHISQEAFDQIKEVEYQFSFVDMSQAQERELRNLFLELAKYQALKARIKSLFDMDE